jgi:hypothetical protein
MVVAWLGANRTGCWAPTCLGCWLDCSLLAHTSEIVVGFRCWRQQGVSLVTEGMKANNSSDRILIFYYLYMLVFFFFIHLCPIFVLHFLLSFSLFPVYFYCPSFSSLFFSSWVSFLTYSNLLETKNLIICQGHRAPDVPDRGYATRSRRPSSPVRVHLNRRLERERERDRDR